MSLETESKNSRMALIDSARLNIYQGAARFQCGLFKIFINGVNLGISSTIGFSKR